jgi:hypothetical protein
MEFKFHHDILYGPNGCSHNKTSQKNYQMTKKNNQNYKNIYVLPFKTMAIMASGSFFIHMNVKEFKPKTYLILSLSFDLEPLKVNTYCNRRNQFCKGL